MARSDPQRFESLLREHQRIVFKVAAVYARHLEDRRDLEQEISAQAWRSFARFDERKAKFSTWLYRIALNVAISQWRQQQRRARDRVESLQAHHLETLSSEPEAEVDERITALYDFIGQLDALNRALIVLYLEDRHYSEIASILGLSETNVATKMSRIKNTLRAQMTHAKPTGA